MPLAIWILSITLVGIAIRRVTPVFIPIWLITTGGATAALLLNQISPFKPLQQLNRT